MTVRACALPADALLRRYDHGGGYADCFVADASGLISLSQYVEAFYTTGCSSRKEPCCPWAGDRPDRQARQLAAGTGSTFAAWGVEERAEDQLLICDITARTRSWFKVAPAPVAEESDRTLLYFGSAITAVREGPPDRMTVRPVFQALVAFHELYSRALLAVAKKRIERLEKKVQP